MIANKFPDPCDLKDKLWSLSKEYVSKQTELNNKKEAEKVYCAISFEAFEHCLRSFYGNTIDGKRIGDIVEECRDNEAQEVNIDREDFAHWMDLTEATNSIED